jgi:hypothetical protein
VPTEEGWTHYRALYAIGKAPVKFVLFPGETHGPRKLTHQLRKMNEEDAWFDLYLFKTSAPENEALKKGSPLDVALRRRSIEKIGTAFGFEPPTGHRYNIETGKLEPALVVRPETVKRGTIEIGRFEVTRAQYAAFDKDFKFAAGTENYPANGVTFEQAQAYCKWLSEFSGETYRLPNENEVVDLYKPRGGENTLDYWAGYSVNPEDAQKLEETIKELPGDAPLLREVGSFAAEGEEGEELIFDLGGNVAEWVVGAGGSGKAEGGSADRPSDNKASYRAADAAYTGFRVVHIVPVPPPAPAAH